MQTRSKKDTGSKWMSYSPPFSNSGVNKHMLLLHFLQNTMITLKKRKTCLNDLFVCGETAIDPV
ncbi:hypothetical protein T05_1563 [Trichinella murrelli]|uniref:Uncharacterized protein n=1 Tax=Trichinella murrelli TaxID=144512 RepID=A0A0V0UDT5_9BILA|nr:hypothetical protein T05_1563 [Trichinella murrelli]